MRTWLITAAATSATFLILDFTWLGAMTSALYRPALAPLLAPDADLPAAAAFYALYIVGILVLAVRPAVKAGSARVAALSGAVLGAVAYGTYDLTNLATLRDWPVALSGIDLAWGMVATTLAASVGYRAARFAGAAG